MHILIVDPPESYARLFDLDISDHVNMMRNYFEQTESIGEALPLIYVIRPDINDGKPTTVAVQTTKGKFDNDDYADVQVRLAADGVVVHSFGYRIDGRA